MNIGMMPKTKGSDEWETPPGLFAELNEEFGFTIDPCASDETAKCELYYTISTDGLARAWGSWGDAAFVNPPYSNILPWLMKAAVESVKGVTSALLLPSRTDTRWFHEMLPMAHEVRFTCGRVKFLLDGKEMGSPRFGSLLAVIRPVRAAMATTLIRTLTT